MSERLSTSEKLRIANSGNYFQETGKNSWVGFKIRKGNKCGVVTCDMNGLFRILTVRFEDGTQEEIQMNNIGQDPDYIHDYEWFNNSTKKWYRF